MHIVIKALMTFLAKHPVCSLKNILYWIALGENMYFYKRVLTADDKIRIIKALDDVFPTSHSHPQMQITD
jgi:hypothetical protein